MRRSPDPTNPLDAPGRSDRQRLAGLAGLELSYPEVGATAWPELPAGYRALERSVTLGSGPSVFERAGTGLLSWQMHRRAGITVIASTAGARTGTDVLLFIGPRPLALAAGCRVVHVVTTDQQRGFSYGTLPGHPESGEESFVVSYRGDGTVTFTVRAFSRPATLPARLAGPLSRRIQDLFTARYLRALRSIAAG